MSKARVRIVGGLSLFLAVAIGGTELTTNLVSANSVNTDTVGCAWTAATWFSAPTTGWGSTAGDSGCTQRANITLDYYQGGWQSTGWQQAFTYWIQWGASPSTLLSGSHQIMVSGNWGQVEYTNE